jgi:hypothetical protein
MHDLTSLGEVIMAMLTLACGFGFPPFASGAFWAIAALWGVVSVVFDDETPRGVPGIDEVRQILRHRHQAHDDRG